MTNKPAGFTRTVAAILPDKLSTTLLMGWRVIAAPFISVYGYFRSESIYGGSDVAAAGTRGTVGVEEEHNPLADYFDANLEGPGLWKWRHYFDVYHRHFRRFIGQEVHIVEIGIFSGGSLNMWQEYFGAGCTVHGVDIEDSCTVYRRDGIEIHIGDQADRDFWKSFREAVPRVDIVVDDGGHTVRQQRITLEELLPHIQPGGVFVCEDVQGSWNRFASYVGGLGQLLHAHNPDSGVVGGSTHSRVKSKLQADVFSVCQYPYMVVIEKNTTPRETLPVERRGTEWQPFIPLPDDQD